MKKLSIKAWTAICMLLLLSLAACGGEATPTATGTGPEAGNAAATTAPAQGKATTVPAKATVAPTEAPTEEPTEEALSVGSRAEGLDQLKSYRAGWKSEWSGVEDGKTVSLSWEWKEEFTSDPHALHFTLTSASSEDPAEQGAFEIWQVGDMSYMVASKAGGEPECTPLSSDSQDDGFERGLFNPSSLGSVNNARYVGTDTINGVRARHYKYDEKTASLTGFGKVNGEIWVAVDGGYVVKDTMQWEGGRGFMGVSASSTETGSGQWAWELSDINQPFTIEPPANCESAASGLPIMDGATEKSIIGDSISYKIASKIDEVAKYYQEAMPAAGWQAEGEPTISEQFASLNFTKDGQTAQIMLSVDNNQTSVFISVEK